MAKKVDPEKSTIEISSRLVRIDAKLQTGDEYKKDIDLSFEIIPEQSSYKIMSTKVELKLKKMDGIRWEKLEGEPGIVVQHPIAPVVLPQVNTCNGPPKYPSSSKKHKDWDSIKIEEDKDEDINQLFQKIYADGNDEMKKAMNKSFIESGGTVLSTNWKEISAGKEYHTAAEVIAFRGDRIGCEHKVSRKKSRLGVEPEEYHIKCCSGVGVCVRDRLLRNGPSDQQRRPRIFAWQVASRASATTSAPAGACSAASKSQNFAK
ncbi:Hypothetical predicted protein [Cloeon dipterum]|uniref:SGS domain-containing protein n=1 Tax=Cloeon dipterum TaxID=197152 RepID=A0A8S1DFY9_9INSE|nr:Hypothetical predicted protein [Cloeon dipterum]